MKVQSSHTMVMADDDSGDDCCNDAEAVAKTGQLCKAGQECPTGSLGILIQPAVDVSPRITALAFSVTPLFIHTFDPSSVWRPPALA
ncbi:hypothetical protein HPT27_11420 [Permianibacter sp. IMCC34836]|uniref:hypothetical protein n=1 Tax=Permianibacter fluminis TaxID=2738515 RepID=UPI001556B091|nr:hypothetical protein [Permianibacter fluminis]NQD37635.1 hypothetical protein [Permianibacter fluminis]